jgi:hypothetical protein
VIVVRTTTRWRRRLGEVWRPDVRAAVRFAETQKQKARGHFWRGLTIAAMMSLCR